MDDLDDFMIEDYTILVSHDSEQMVDKVKHLIAQGWVMHGTLVIWQNFLVQAMVKHPDVIHDTIKAMLDDLQEDIK